MIRMDKLALCALGCMAAFGAPPTASSPYGTCAHLSRPGEFETRVAEMERMKAAGIDWCRTDFDWKHVEPAEGTWTFEHLDKLMADADRLGIAILPILDYEVKWVPYPWQPDALPRWRDYVRRVVSRYRGRCPVWEVWNEQNVTQGGAHPAPSPAEYARLLQAAYEEIKAADPAARVAVGGYALVPLPYIEGVYKAGGGAFFDIMNVHPYQHTDKAEGAFEKAFAGLRALMAKYGDAAKPVWATEIGLMTRAERVNANGLLAAALGSVDPAKKWRILCTAREAAENMRVRIADPAFVWPAGATVAYCTFTELEARLAAGGVDALVFPFCEEYPADAMDAVRAFVKAGGTLVDFGGMAFFKPVVWKDNGTPRVVQDAARACADRKRFRFETEYWYSNKKVPLDFKAAPTPALDKAAAFTPARIRRWGETRSFKPVELQGNDRFVPLLTCRTNDYDCTSLAWIRYDSDLKGNLILGGYFERGLREPFTEEMQGKGCARQLNQAFAMGYEKVFWYEFQQCSDYGIVRRKTLEARPAYVAYAAFTRERPAGSVALPGPYVHANGDVYCPQWRCPDGTRAGAVWSVSGRGVAPAAARAAASYADYLGRPLPALPEPLPDTPVYYRFPRP